MPDATPTSIEPPSPGRRSRLWLAAQIVITAIVLWYVGRTLVDQWTKFRGSPIEVHPRWAMIAFSSVLMLSGYAVLIETWRRIILAWGDYLDFRDAARIWCISNLGKYVPGKVWSIGAMAELARQRRVSPTAAAGSSIINVAVNIACGIVVALLAGWSAVNSLSRGRASIVALLAAAGLLGLLALPMLLPPALALVRRVTKRQIALAALPHRAIYVAIVGNLIAWTLYGLAFRAFVSGVIGHADGGNSDYIAVYASSYVVGYLALAIPGGIGPREGAQTNALTMLHLATFGQALVIAVTSRLWLTVLEIVPALLFLAQRTRARPETTTARDGSNT